MGTTPVENPWRGRPRTAKSCGPDASVLASSPAEVREPDRADVRIPRGDGGKKADHRGEREGNR
jgi:hypothetical protein